LILFRTWGHTSGMACFKTDCSGGVAQARQQPPADTRSPVAQQPPGFRFALSDGYTGGLGDVDERPIEDVLAIIRTKHRQCRASSPAYDALCNARAVDTLTSPLSLGRRPIDDIDRVALLDEATGLHWSAEPSRIGWYWARLDLPHRMSDLLAVERGEVDAWLALPRTEAIQIVCARLARHTYWLDRTAGAGA
jgi:hypothetical protein